MAETQEQRRRKTLSYQPGPPPQLLEGLPRYIHMELQRIAVVLNDILDQLEEQKGA